MCRAVVNRWRAPVRVNAVSPGLIATPLWSGLPEDQLEAMYAAAAQRLPARRVGQPEDVANAVLFLATTSFATGSTVRVDGGGAIARGYHARSCHVAYARLFAELRLLIRTPTGISLDSRFAEIRSSSASLEQNHVA